MSASHDDAATQKRVRRNKPYVLLMAERMAAKRDDGTTAQQILDEQLGRLRFDDPSAVVDRIYREQENSVLLAEVDAERNKFHNADNLKLGRMVDALVKRGVYPVTPVMRRYHYSALTMVLAWGAHWHVWQGLLSCPHCRADLGDHAAGPPFKRETKNTCPDCHAPLLK
jgi:hypothetical protein